MEPRYKPLALLRKFKSPNMNNLMELEGKLAIDKFGVEPIFYLSIYKRFERKNPDSRINIQFTPFEMLSFAEALAGVLEGDNPFRYYSGGKESGKWIVIQMGSGNKDVFLNFESEGRKISISYPVSGGKALVLAFREAVSALWQKSDEVIIGQERKKARSPKGK